MTIQQITDKVIQRIRAFPHEAKFSQADVSPRTSWDEYKEQLQYDEYHNFDMFQETVDTMVDDAIGELSFEEIDLSGPGKLFIVILSGKIRTSTGSRV